MRRLTRCSCGQSRKVCSFSWLNREPVTFVKDPELIRPSIPVMTQSLDQKVMARKAKSPDLSPPFIDMYTCDVCNRTFHWQCLPKTSCCNATEREAIDANNSWACPACINQNEKKIVSSTLTKERLWRFHGTQPGSQKNCKTRVKLQAEPQKV